MKTKSVLIITSQGDLHASAVIEQLELCARSVFRLNTEMFLQQTRAAMRQSGALDAITIQALDARREINLDEIGAVYYRRPDRPLPPASLQSDATVDYATKEADAFLHAFYSFLDDRFWLSDPLDIRRASSKLKQIKTARAAGLDVPDTLYTNDPDQVRQFCSTHGKMVIKSLHEQGFVDGDNYKAFYTTIIGAATLLNDLDTIPLTVNFLQEAVPKLYELRVTAVGNTFFTVRIDSQRSTELALDDWRREDVSCIPHSVVTIPDGIRESLLRFLHKMGLPFGCFDVIVTPENKYVFLECNFNGQWLWIEEMTGLPISKAIAELLDRNCGDPG